MSSISDSGGNEMVDANLARQIIKATIEELEAISQLHSCIVAASVLTTAFARVNIPSNALAVYATVFNPIYAQRIRDNGLAPLSEAADQQCRTDGGRLVQVGADLQPGEELEDGEFPGHVAVVIPDFRPGAVTLVDLAIIQANDPELNVYVDPLIAHTFPGFVHGSEQLWSQNHDCLVVYSAKPDDTRF